MFGNGNLMRSNLLFLSAIFFESKHFACLLKFRIYLLQMLALLEEMYYELGLVGYANKNKYAVGDKALKRLLLKVEELEIHPATLKRFLLRVQENCR